LISAALRRVTFHELVEDRVHGLGFVPLDGPQLGLLFRHRIAVSGNRSLHLLCLGAGLFGGNVAVASRELSVKVNAGACRNASLGFRSGATPGYGLRRELVDENKQSKGILGKGQRKYLQTDHVLLRPGPNHELDIVRRIFREFFVERKSQAQIARQLNLDTIPNHREKPWTDWMIHYLLQNENYIGNIVYSRKTFKLRRVIRNNPPEHWIRSSDSLPSIVDKTIFAKAQMLMKCHYVRRSDDQLLAHLRAALNKNGRLSATIMNPMSGLPSTALYVWRFGSLRNAFRLIGHRSSRNCEYIDSRPALTAKLREKELDIARGVRALGAADVFDVDTDVMTVDGRLAVSFRVARYCYDAQKAPVWHINRQAVLLPGMILAVD
jgi:hypothetical protein